MKFLKLFSTAAFLLFVLTPLKASADTYLICNTCDDKADFKKFAERKLVPKNKYIGKIYMANPVTNKTVGLSVRKVPYNPPGGTSMESPSLRIPLPPSDDHRNIHNLVVGYTSVPSAFKTVVNQLHTEVGLYTMADREATLTGVSAINGASTRSSRNAPMYAAARSNLFGPFHVDASSGLETAWAVASNNQNALKLDDYLHDEFPISSWGAHALQLLGTVGKVGSFDMAAAFEGIKYKVVFSNGSTVLVTVAGNGGARIGFNYVLGSARSEGGVVIPDRSTTFDREMEFDNYQALDNYFNLAAAYGFTISSTYTCHSICKVTITDL